MRTKYVNLLAATLFSITSIAGVALSNILTERVVADESKTAMATINVSSACSLQADITTPHTAVLAPGIYSESVPDYAKGIGSTTFTAFCSDTGGYAIYVVGYTGDIEGVNTMVGDATGLTIATGTAKYGDDSQWAMKLSKITDSSVSYLPDNLNIQNGFGSFRAIPNSYTKAVTYSSQTDTVKGSKIAATYAVYIQPAQAADTYVGKVKYTLVHPNTNDPSSFVVNFYANGGTGTMNSQKITRGQATALTSNSFTAPTGMAFISWNTAPDGSGTSYADGEQVTNLADAGDTITLYAQWREIMTFDKAYALAGKTKHNGYYTMQDGTSAICNNVETGQIGTLIDTRDDTTYSVGKLADSNCWLLDNLALDLTNTDVKTAMLNSADTKTNASYQTLGYLFNGGGTTADQYPTAKLNNVAWTSSAQNYYDVPMMVKSGTCNDAYCVNDPTSGNWSYDSTTQATINNLTSYAQGKIGIYYNYCAASAGSYCYAYGTNVDSAGTAIDAAEDICPAGWRLPTGGPISTSGNNNGGGEFQNLYNQYNNVQAFQIALSTPLSGDLEYGVAHRQGSGGYFWSSTYMDNNHMYYLYVGSKVAYPQYYVSRWVGFTIRCLLPS